MLHYIHNNELKNKKDGKIINKEQKNFHDGMTSAEEIEIQKQLPKGDSITEQNVAGWWTIDLS